MPFITDPRYTQSAIVGPVRSDLFATPEPEDKGPGALETAGAAFRQSNSLGAGYEYAKTAAGQYDEPAPPDFDPLDHIGGYEDHAKSFVGADSPGVVAAIKQRIDDERKDRTTLARAGIGGTLASLVSGLLDPSFLAAAGVPEIALAKAARTGKVLTAALRGATGAAAYESGMQALQVDRPISESAINVGAGALLGGVLGSIVRNVPSAERKMLTDALRRELQGTGARSEVGAAASGPMTTLEQESIARGGQTLEKVLGAIPLARTDLSVVLNSDSVEARQALQELADVAPVMQKNTEGIASPTSVESLVGRHEGRVADFIDMLKQKWAEYRARVPRVGRLSREDFYAGVASAARRGDTSVEPEIADAAKYLRARVFDPLKQDAQGLGLLPADADVGDTADSYFRRMYDRDAIRKDRREWDSILTSHFVRKGAEYAEARSIAEDITRKILGQDVGQANFNVRTYAPKAGPLHERTLDIPDEQIERFLVNDPSKVAQSYVRELAPQIEMARRFGDKDMTATMQRIKDSYDVMREKIRAGAPRDEASDALTKLSDNEKKTLEAMGRIRDRVLGISGRLSPNASDQARLAVKALRGWRNFVAAGRLGVAALTSAATDTGRIVAQYGLLPTIGKIARLATSSDFRALSKAQARRLGAAIEVTMARRVNVAYDAAPTEGWTHKLAQGVYTLSGLNHWTDFGRTLSATLLEDRVLKAAQAVAEGKSPGSKWIGTHLASLGLDADSLKAIAKEVEKHGGEVGGTRVSGSANWDDAALAEKYDAAILKESRMMVMQPGAADKAWWQDSETGKVLGQLKAFSMAAPHRFLMAPAQMIGNGHYAGAARFVGAMMAGGALAHVLRSLEAGKQPASDPAQLAYEAFNESGLGGIMPDMVSPLARRFGILGESARYADRNVLSTFGGPALGTVGDAYDLIMNRTANGMSASDLHLLRRLMPYQNVWWLRRAINGLEGETADALNLRGADYKTFGQRVTETTPLTPANQRGGTGVPGVVDTPRYAGR